jgi:hypothetical protein
MFNAPGGQARIGHFSERLDARKDRRTTLGERYKFARVWRMFA